METVLIKSAQLAYPKHPLNGKIVHVLIQKGALVKIQTDPIEEVPENGLVINGSGCVLAPGFFDLNVNFGEPGLETKEDIQSGAEAAAAGGFTGVAVQPNTHPAIQSRTEVSLIKNLAKDLLVDVFPIGAISIDRKGEALTEMYDMHIHGAVAFSDGDRSVQQAGLMNRALLYAHGFDALVMSFAQDDSLVGENIMNEGEMSTFLGIKGSPALAESMRVARDLYLAEYNQTAIHFSTVSTAESIRLIKKAKKNGMKVTCDVAAHHLLLTDEYVKDFDSQYKVIPPLRSEEDRAALIQAVKEGTIDCITSQHTPHEVEYKNVEFQAAKPGIIGLQTLLATLLDAGLSLEIIVEKLSLAPRRVLDLPVPELKEEEKANLVLIDQKAKWIFDEKVNKSKSQNSPFWKKELKGKVRAVFNNEKHLIFE